MAHAKQVLTVVKPKKHSVRFDANPKDKHPIFSGIYASRENVEKMLGIKNLNKAKSLELTIRVNMGSNSSDASDEDEE